jgi:phosphoglycolate phosphatase-like HAD superfamily hydrolase
MGLNDREVDDLLPKVLARMSKIYPRIERKLTLNRGVTALLQTLAASPMITIGVLTGNLTAVANQKLEDTGIRSYFSELFCADHYLDRISLAKDAVAASVSKYRLSRRKAVILVGDTPRDIEAANASGATSIGVASGSYSIDILRDAGASYVTPTLEPMPGLLSALGAKATRL